MRPESNLKVSSSIRCHDVSQFALFLPLFRLTLFLFDILKFSLAGRLRGHKQRKFECACLFICLFVSSWPYYQAEYLCRKWPILNNQACGENITIFALTKLVFCVILYETLQWFNVVKDWIKPYISIVGPYFVRWKWQDRLSEFHFTSCTHARPFAATLNCYFFIPSGSLPVPVLSAVFLGYISVCVVRESQTEKHERSTAEAESFIKRLVPGK